MKGHRTVSRFKVQMCERHRTVSRFKVRMCERHRTVSRFKVRMCERTQNCVTFQGTNVSYLQISQILISCSENVINFMTVFNNSTQWEFVHTACIL